MMENGKVIKHSTITALLRAHFTVNSSALSCEMQQPIKKLSQVIPLPLNGKCYNRQKPKIGYVVN